MAEPNDSDERGQLESLNAVARACITAGFPVFPAAVWVKQDGSVGKAPLTKHGHLDAHLDAQRIYQDLASPFLLHRPDGVPDDYELAVAFVPGRGGCGVLDCDVKHGSQGKESARRLEAEHGLRVASAWTTPSGGVNILWRKPTDTEYSNASPWPGIDVRADNGWCIAPGNVCAAGGWAWAVGNYTSPDELPFTMIAELKPAGAPGKRKASSAETVAFIERSPQTSAPEALRKFHEQLELFKRAGSGSRHEAMVRIVGWAFGMGSLDLRFAMQQINAVWAGLMAATGELQRAGEADEFATWCVAQELPSRRAAVQSVGGVSTIVRQPSVDPADFVPGGPIPGPAVTVDPLLLATRNLPEDFWQRQQLDALRRWAHAAQCSGDAVYAATRARYGALMPWAMRVDTGIAVPMSLNSLVAIVANSGGGKSTSIAMAHELVDLDLRTDIYEGPLGSGEGVAELFFELIDQTPPAGGKTVKVRQQTKFAALLRLDEGEALTRMGDRSGSTIMPTLRSAYSGELIGQTNARLETRRVLKPHTYRLIVLLGVQAAACSDLLADTAGTAQRFVFFNANDPTIPDRQATAPPRPWSRLPVPATVTATKQHVTLCDEVRQEVWDRRLSIQRGETVVPELDSHRDQNRLKEAAMLALLDGQRLRIEEEDWALAGMILDTSDAIRAWALRERQAAAERAEDGRTSVVVRRTAAVADDEHRRALESGAANVARRAQREGGTVGRTELSRAVAGRLRQLASLDEMLDFAVQMDWLKPTAGGWTPGSSKPV